MFLILIALQACMLLYANSSPNITDLWLFVWNMDNWSSLGFIITLTAIALALGGQGFFSGSSFRFITDFIVMGPALAGLIGMGVVFTNLANLIRSELIGRIFTDCDVSHVIPCTPVLFIIAITIGPLAFFYTWTVVEWWRGKDF
jgi:hypothetical protein